ncbi:regulatory sensor-transducer of BlaR1/MecR1 family [alpha proteobacterium U9-1i]|nr:regulatory sensor-transducer of BlaR1/MecR1 family [alpha proteobacterium U9-1i]
MLDLILEIALKSALVSALALALVMALRNLPAAQRAWIAHLGLALSLAMPLIVLLGPKLEMTGPWSRVTHAATGAPMSAGDVVAASPLPSHRVDVGLLTNDIVLIVYASVAAALLLALALGLVRLFRLQRDAAVLTEPNWLCALAETQHRMGLKQGTALLCSPQLAAPVSWGLLRPTIMLSPTALKASDKAEAILAHELAHVARMDWVNLLIARLATALYWFNPIVWALAWQAHELREEAADDVVLRGEVRGSDYASLLMGFARAGRAPVVCAHGVTPGKNSLRRRLERVLNGDARRDPARPMWVAICAGVALGVAAPVGAFTPVDHAAPGVKTHLASYDFDLDQSGVDVTDFDASYAEAAEDAEPPEPAEASEPPEPPELGELDGGRTYMRDGRLSPQALAQLRTFDITPQWLDNMEREIANVRQLPLDDIVALAALGVTPQYIRSLSDAGYRNLDIDELKAFAAHEISPAFIRELATAGYADLAANDLIALRVAGIDAQYIRSMESVGLRIDRRDGARTIGRAGPSPAPPPPIPRSSN